ncbi:hypothetical protein ALC62_15569, partial [Cyphomyrmex costatus]
VTIIGRKSGTGAARSAPVRFARLRLNEGDSSLSVRDALAYPTDRPVDHDPPTLSHRVCSKDLVAASAFVRVHEKDSPLACPYLNKHQVQRRAARSFCRKSTYMRFTIRICERSMCLS